MICPLNVSCTMPSFNLCHSRCDRCCIIISTEHSPREVRAQCNPLRKFLKPASQHSTPAIGEKKYRWLASWKITSSPIMRPSKPVKTPGRCIPVPFTKSIIRSESLPGARRGGLRPCLGPMKMTADNADAADTKGVYGIARDATAQAGVKPRALARASMQ